MSEAGDLRRLTHAFVVTAGAVLVATLAAPLAGAGTRTVGVAVVFGFVCPTAFGMGYLLLPSYVGRTLAHPRLAAVHYPLAFGGAALLVGDWLGAVGPALGRLGGVLWGAGVAVFVGALLATVVPALRSGRDAVSGPERSSWLSVVALPVAVGYLIAGAAGVLAEIGTPRAVHLHAAGFAALLIFALGDRLLVGFLHAAAPRPLTVVAICGGAVGPALLVAFFRIDPWFRVAAATEAAAMVAYAGMVTAVVSRSDRLRVGVAGVTLGALSGVVAVGAAVALAFGGSAAALEAHVAAVATGFFPLTVAGYAVEFFPVTGGRFRGASERGVLAVLALLAAGSATQVAGGPRAAAVGAACSTAGALGYCYLLGRRLYG